MTISILQSNYIPWKGYFDVIAKSEVFVLYDEVQFTKNDWRNRNLIKTNNGKQWLTIPVKQTGLDQKICETLVSFPNWKKKHLGSIQANYAKATAFKEVRDFVWSLYDIDSMNLSQINTHIIKKVCQFLGIDTKIVHSHELGLQGNRVEKLVDACVKLGASTYLSGPSAKDYIDEATFRNSDINVEWMSYEGYKQYDQLYPPFEHGVSVLDLLFNTGTEARDYMKY